MQYDSNDGFLDYLFKIVSSRDPSLTVNVDLYLKFTLFPTDTKVDLPEFPLIPASKGFCITLRKTLQQFKGILESVGVSTYNLAPPHSNIEDNKKPMTPVNTPNFENKATKVPYAKTEMENVVGHNL